PYDAYICERKIRLGKDGCDTPNVPRAEVDSRVFAYFMEVGFDWEATRASFAESADRKLAELRALREDAEREEQHAPAPRRRVKRDYQDGKLAADDWNEQRDELTA